MIPNASVIITIEHCFRKKKSLAKCSISAFSRDIFVGKTYFAQSFVYFQKLLLLFKPDELLGVTRGGTSPESKINRLVIGKKA